MDLACGQTRSRDESEVDNRTLLQHPNGTGTSQGASSFTPDWKVVREEVEWVFLFHSYGFACLFFLMAFYALFTILNIRSQLSSRPYVCTMNVFLLVLGICRALCLFLDPYGYRQVFPSILSRLLWDLGFPCLTSAFCLIQLAFLQLIAVPSGPEKWLSRSLLSIMMTAHCCLTLSTDVVSSFDPNLSVLRLLVCVVFVLWDLTLCGCFFHTAASLRSRLEDATFHPWSNLQAGPVPLSLLSNCNSVASAALKAGEPVRPKIKVTDENERTVVFCSSGSDALDGVSCGGAGGGGLARPSMDASLLGLRRWSSSSVASVRSSWRLGSVTSLFPDDSRRGSSGAEEEEETEAMEDISERDESEGVSSEDPAEGAARRAAPAAIRSQKSRRRVDGHGRRRSSRGASYEPPAAAAPATGEGRRRSVGAEKARVERPPSRRSVEIRHHARPPPLPSTPPANGLTLRSVLNQIAFVDSGARGVCAAAARYKSTGAQVRVLLRKAVAVAILSAVLATYELFLAFGPYGPADAPTTASAGTCVRSSSRANADPWSWLAFHTTHRAVELATGCLVANVGNDPSDKNSQYLAPFRKKNLPFV